MMNLLKFAQPARKGLTGVALTLVILCFAARAIAQEYQLNDVGSGVGAIQRALNVYPDEIYGEVTEQAVRDFQERRGLQSDGIAGPETLRALGLDYLVTESSRCSGSSSRACPYVVVVPGNSANLLANVSNVVSGATRSQSRLGTFIRAGAFSQRSGAEQRARLLRDHGLDARIAYRP